MNSHHHVQAKPSSEVASMSSEFENLLQSLPCEIGSTSDPLYHYSGFWFASEDLEGMLASQRHFQALDTDILLVTTPKSGTTWLKSLVFSIATRTKHKIFDINHPLYTTNPHTIIPFIEQMYYTNPTPEISSTPPRLFSTHVPYSMLPESVRTSSCRIIYICRNPKDVFVSMRHFGAKYIAQMNPAWQLLPIQEAFDKFCKGMTWFGPFWNQTLDFWRLSSEIPEKVLFLRYEDLQRDITSQVKRIAEYLGCPFSLKEEDEGVIEEIIRMCSFENLSNLKVNRTGKDSWMVDNKDFFRKGEVGDWMNHLTAPMVEQLDQVMEEKLRGTGLTLN